MKVSKKILPMSKLGPVWKEWYEVVFLEMENHILREVDYRTGFLILIRTMGVLRLLHLVETNAS
jgi:hypothetical protein